MLEEGEQRWVGAGILEHVNGGGVDVVVLIAFPFFFELVDEDWSWPSLMSPRGWLVAAL